MSRVVPPALRIAGVLLTGALSVGCADDAAPLAEQGGESPAPASATPSTSIPVVASTDVYADIVRAIGGRHVDVVEIIAAPGQDPHSYEATGRDQLAVARAQLIVENGGGYDDFMSQLRDAAGGSVVTVVAVDVVEQPAADGAEAPVGPPNEHVWYDLDAVTLLAQRIGDELAGLASPLQSEFEANLQTFIQRVTLLKERLADLRAEHQGSAVALTEPLPGYLVEDAGLVNRTPAEFSEAIEEGTEVPARVLVAMVDLVTQHQVEALIYNEQTAGPETERVREAAETAGIPIIPVTETLPDGTDYVGWMDANIDALEEALP